MTLTRTEWRQRGEWNTICATSAGRRKYNQERKRWANERRDLVWELLLKYGLWEWGTLSRIARELQVHRSTVCRDRKNIVRDLLGR
jgi:hypothetical protein